MKPICSALLFCLLFSGSLFAQSLSKEEKGKLCYQLCEKYFPSGIEVLDYRKKDWYFTKWIHGDTEGAVLTEFSTVIHECYHGYENKLVGAVWGKTGYFLGDDIRIVVEHSTVYPTPELDPFIPDSLKDEDMNFRYDPYIVGDLTISAHEFGIYGLMEEMNAYYLGGLASYHLWDYYREKCGDDIYSCLAGPYLQSVGGDVLAYYQFRFFLAWYLEHAETHYPEVYRGIMYNHTFRVAFTLLDIKFRELEQMYLAKVDELVELGNAAGQELSVKDGWLYHQRTAGSRTGRGIFLDDMKRLDNAFLPRWQDYYNRLRIKTVTIDNWKDYL